MKVDKLHNQDYESLFVHASRKGIPFVDPEFPPNDLSIYPTRNVRIPIEWRRIRDISQFPKLIQPEGALTGGAESGLLGDCWLLPAIRVLKTHQHLLHKVIPAVKDQDWLVSGNKVGMSNSRDVNVHPGIFRFRFYRFGKWIEVVVDDYLPMYSTAKTSIESIFPHDEPHHSRLIFGRSANTDEWWCSLMEKAYAKLCGSYQALELGSPEDALVDLSGTVPERLDLADEALIEQIGLLGFFEMFKRVKEQGSLISANIAPLEDEEVGEVLPNGLVVGQEYCIEGTLRLSIGSWNKKPVYLVKVHCNHEREWNGPWSPASHEWEKVPDSIKKNLDVIIGDTYMTVEDFIYNFSNLTICRNVERHSIWSPPSWHMFTFRGEWSIQDDRAGGSVNHSDTFHCNPQYIVAVGNPTFVIISLMQKDCRNELRQNHTIGFCILRVENNRDFRVRGPDHEITFRATYMDAREVSGRVALSPGRYVLIPSTMNPDQETEYLVRVGFSKKPLFCKPLLKEVFIADPMTKNPKQAWYKKFMSKMPQRTNDVFAGMVQLQIITAELKKPHKGIFAKVVYWDMSSKKKKPTYLDVIPATPTKTTEPDFHATQYIFPIKLGINIDHESDTAPRGDGMIFLQLFSKRLFSQEFLGEVRIRIAPYTTRVKMNQVYELARPLTKVTVLPEGAAARLVALGGAGANIGDEYVVNGMMPRPRPRPNIHHGPKRRPPPHMARKKGGSHSARRKAKGKTGVLPGVLVDESAPGPVQVKLPDGRWGRKSEAGTGTLRYRIAFMTD